MKEKCKIIKRILVYVLIVCSLCWPFICIVQCSCGVNDRSFYTKYTQEQHVQRIRERTNIKYQDDIESGIIEDFEVFILYDLNYNYPEYFIVEFQYSNHVDKLVQEEIIESDGKGNITCRQEELVVRSKYFHVTGCIIDDLYYTTFTYGSNYRHGQSSYSLGGYQNQKKYFGNGYEFVEIDGEIIQIGHMYPVTVDEITHTREYWWLGKEFEIYADEHVCQNGEKIEQSEYENYKTNFFHYQKSEY